MDGSLNFTKITIITVLIYSAPRVCSESLGKRKNKQFCVQEFSAYREFNELTRQNDKLGIF